MIGSTVKYLVVSGIMILYMGLTIGCGSTNHAERSKQGAGTDKIDIGYGQVDRQDLTGAVSAIDTLVYPSKSVADILKGRAAGVDVEEVQGGGIRVRVRGANSFIGGNAPLYVIDGMPVRTENGVLYDINPYDIESITILKDSASTAIYGSRGANGVVLIKTKL